jgi:hypothetical protein
MSKKAPKRVVHKEVPNCGFDGKIIPLNSIVVAVVGSEYRDVTQSYIFYPWKKGDCLLYLGEIVNMPGHCIVSTNDGKIHWGFHTDNFRIATEDET